MILSADVLTILIIDTLLMVFATIAFFLALRIVRYYDKSSSSSLQYMLEKQSYLATTIIKFILIVKSILFIFFIYTLDGISDLLTGAMCAAGVVNATQYGAGLLILKMLNLYLFGYWIVLNKLDTNSLKQPYFQLKFLFYFVIFLLVGIEMLLDVALFSSLDMKSVVDCCGAIFSTTDASYVAIVLSHGKLLALLFYINLFALVMMYALKQRYLFGVLNLTFVVLALLSLIAYFGTYIYELPTHHCPFCMLQKEYHYIGYLLYLLVFGGTFYGSSVALFSFREAQQNSFVKRSLALNWLYGIIVTLYVVAYVLKNGVWL